MQERETVDRLNRLADEFFSPDQPRYALRSEPPFNLARETKHQSKAEFEADLKAATGLLKHLGAVNKLLDDLAEKDPPTLARTQSSIEKVIRDGTRRRKIRGGSSRDLVIQNVRETGFFDNSRDVLSDLLFACEMAVRDLEAQKANFWSGRNRPPDHYARIVALRFARLFRQETGKTPTFGTSSQGGHPSTDFGRALEKVFLVLGIETGFRLPAVWALKQLEKELILSRPEPMGLSLEDMARVRALGRQNS